MTIVNVLITTTVTQYDLTPNNNIKSNTTTNENQSKIMNELEEKLTQMAEGFNKQQLMLTTLLEQQQKNIVQSSSKPAETTPTIIDVVNHPVLEQNPTELQLLQPNIQNYQQLSLMLQQQQKSLQQQSQQQQNLPFVFPFHFSTALPNIMQQQQVSPSSFYVNQPYYTPNILQQLQISPLLYPNQQNYLVSNMLPFSQQLQQNNLNSNGNGNGNDRNKAMEMLCFLSMFNH